MTPKRLLNISIKFYTSPKKFIPPKQISGYAPEIFHKERNERINKQARSQYLLADVIKINQLSTVTTTNTKAAEVTNFMFFQRFQCSDVFRWATGTASDGH